MQVDLSRLLARRISLTRTKTCSLSTVVVLCLVFLYGVTFSYITILKHYAYMSTAYDLGNSEKILWSTLNEGKFFENTAYYPGPQSEFASHFVPIWFLVLFVYALHQTPETLLVLQSFALAAGAIPLFMLARREIGDGTGVGLAALYLLNPALHWINWFDFHTVALAIPFLSFAFFYLRTERYYSAIVFALLGVFCAEYVAFTVVGLGAYVLWTKRKHFRDGVANMVSQRWFLGAVSLLLIGLVWIPLAVVAIHVFSASVYMEWRYAWLGTGLEQILARLPATISSVLSDPERINYVNQLFVPTLFLALSDLPVVLIPIGTFVFNLLSSFEPQHDIQYQYAAPILPFLYMATISTFRHVRNDATFQRRLLAIVLIASIVQVQLYGPVNTLSFPSRTMHDEALDAVVSLVPQNASISTQNEIFPHIARRSAAYLSYVDNVDYVLIDTTSPWYSGPAPSVPPYNQVLPQILSKYGVMTAIDGIVLLKAHYTGPPVYVDSLGLVAKFYNNLNMTGEPAFIERVFTINFDWGLLGSPFPTVNARDFTATFEGWFRVEAGGVYGFRLLSDDGSRLYVDGKLLIDGWGQGAIDMNASIQLDPGSHSIRVEYVQYDLFDSLHLFISTPGQGYSIPPQGFFTAAP